MNLYASAEANSRKTWLYLFLFFLFVIAIGWAASWFLQSFLILQIAVGLSIAMSVGSYWYSDKMVLKLAHAKPIEMTDTIVCEDFVVQVFYPEKVKKMINRVFEKSKKVDQVDWDTVYSDIFEEKVKIPVLLNKNKQLSELIRAQLKSYFK